MSEFTKTVRTTIKHWYLHLIIGLLLILVGAYVFTNPVDAYVTLAFIFGITFLFTGIIEIIYAIANRHELDSWGWSLAGGILDVLIGIIILSRPEIGMIVLAFIVGFALLFRSMLSVSWSMEIRKYQSPNWGWMLAIGIIGVILAFILLWNPIIAGATVVIWTAVTFIAIGIFEIILSFNLKKLKNKID
ncbi:HdeD family acid-resistance protein [Mangrovivirga sp. M17]|uniref:HdeD family acid-resistance protein n=1 Tax=Mangrovivirga halotolerans TaxID=2993936 RepID=A0ABT3RQ33_9BACT|nr:HdeD family acid-resistance protein [Mangrovivirga halotolerans]MCX2743906.1 HdeD family acid-resistance protein [Mangrovivirga halotolerans]